MDQLKFPWGEEKKLTFSEWLKEAVESYSGEPEEAWVEKHRESLERLIMRYPDYEDFNYYQEMAKRTASKLPPQQKLLNWSLGLAGEAGEVCDSVKKYVFHGHALDHDHMVKELGDILWYLSQMAETLDIDLATIAEKNIAKLKARYPEGFNSERSINRED